MGGGWAVGGGGMARVYGDGKSGGEALGTRWRCRLHTELAVVVVITCEYDRYDGHTHGLGFLAPHNDEGQRVLDRKYRPEYEPCVEHDREVNRQNEQAEEAQVGERDPLQAPRERFAELVS